jgi:Fur family ferric uptake transcriptional regulator
MGMRMDNNELRKAGLKVTAPRLKILDVLQSAGEDAHMSAEDVGLATVYRVLTQFEQAGLVSRHHFDSGLSVFELSSDDHHDHMVCTETGQVVEFYDETIEKLQHHIAEKHGFELVDHSLVLYVRPKNS